MLDLHTLKRNFSAAMLSKGFECWRLGDVEYSEWATATLIKGEVAKNPLKKHKVVIELDLKNEKISSKCDCPNSYNCEHAAAILYTLMQQGKPFYAQAKPKTDLFVYEARSLLYQLTRIGHELVITPRVVNVRKDGSLYKSKTPTPLAVYKGDVDAIKRDDDWYILGKLKKSSDNYANFTLSNFSGKKILNYLLNTERCYLNDIDYRIIQGLPIRSHLVIEEYKQGHLKTKFINTDTRAVVDIFPLGKGYYYIHDLNLGETHISSNDEVLDLIFDEYFEGDLLNEAKNIITCTDISEQPKPTLTLSKHQEQARATLSFQYGTYMLEYIADIKTQHNITEDKILSIHRNYDLEIEYYQQLQSLGLVDIDNSGNFTIKEQQTAKETRDSWLDVMTIMAPALKQQGWEVIYDKSFQFQVTNTREDVNLKISNTNDTNNDWFDFHISTELENGEKLNLIPVFINIISQKDKYKKMMETNDPQKKIFLEIAAGNYIQLPLERVYSIINFLHGLDSLGLVTQEDSDDNVQEKITLSKRDAMFLQEMQFAEMKAQERWYEDDKILQLAKGLTGQHETKDYHIDSPPNSLKTELRDYQIHGLQWLNMLYHTGFAGILADDMGLGKTIQTIAFLCLLYQKCNGQLQQPILIISPTSLVGNWASEIAKFAPHFSTIAIYGKDRQPLYKEAKNCDIIITTYPIITRDKDIISQQEYSCVVLDEAQVIKNPRAKVTQVVQQIDTKFRVCLTGTPLENSLTELWSQFHFLMPGFLGNYQNFQRSFKTPIEKHQDETQKDILIKRIKPFILRRTKKEVMAELPSKTVILHKITMGEEQNDLYQSVRLRMNTKVSEALSAQGLNRSHILVLDALLKLRQICCDPRLLKIKHNVEESAKLKALLAMLSEMIVEGRKILLFSQFTEMLDLIKIMCDEHKIPYVMLTGSTKDRDTPVQRFQNGEVPLFLISLKAGGVGLNLTAADVVIHYDPWWNPAAENQATDRAYRIGQDKPVFVYKFITQNTVEEKIIALQEKKQHLSDAILDNSIKKAASLSEADIADLLS